MIEIRQKSTTKKGGARKGAGRKVANHTLLTSQMKQMMVETLHKRFQPLLEAQIDAAIGVTTEKFDRKKGDYYYQEEGPNVAAAKFITEHVMGRPKESIEHSGQIGGIAGLILKLDKDED